MSLLCTFSILIWKRVWIKTEFTNSVRKKILRLRLTYIYLFLRRECKNIFYSLLVHTLILIHVIFSLQIRAFVTQKKIQTQIQVFIISFVTKCDIHGKDNHCLKNFGLWCLFMRYYNNNITHFFYTYFKLLGNILYKTILLYITLYKLYQQSFYVWKLCCFIANSIRTRLKNNFTNYVSILFKKKKNSKFLRINFLRKKINI